MPRLVEVSGVLQVQRTRRGVVQPGVPTTESDQILVQGEHFTAGFVEMIWGRAEFRAHCVIAADPLLFDPAIAEFVAGVDGRDAASGEQQNQGVSEALGTVQATGDAGHVVVADEGLRGEPAQEVVVALQRPVEFVEVAVVETAPHRFPQLVLRHRVDTRSLDETDIVAVDDLGDEPRLRAAAADAG